MIVSIEARIGFRGSGYGRGGCGEGDRGFEIRDATMTAKKVSFDIVFSLSHSKCKSARIINFFYLWTGFVSKVFPRKTSPK